MTFESFNHAYLESLQRAERNAEEHFVRYFSALIELKTRSRGYTREAADDVLQETFARAFLLIRKPDGVQEPERLGALMNSICNNVMREQFRSDTRAEPLEDEVAAMLTEPRADALSRLMDQDTTAAVSAVLRQLNERDRNLLREVLLKDADKDAVCARMGVSRDHLRVLLHRAKVSFRDRYTSTFPNGAHGTR